MSDELELFRREMVGVKTIDNADIADTRTKFAPTLAQLQRRQAAEQQLADDMNYLSMEFVEFVEPEQILDFRRDGVQHGVHKRMRLGQYELEATLDLHNHSLRQARKALFEFVSLCHQRGVRSALVVHGMGKFSKPQPALLKSYVNKWLQQMEPVIAFHSSQRQHGGAGSVYLLLKKNAEQKLYNRELHQRR